MNVFEKIKNEILKCIHALCLDKKLTSEASNIDFSVEIPKEKAFGELSTNVALLLGKIEEKNPRQIAEILKEELKNNSMISRVEIAGPGFLNFIINNSLWFEVIVACIKNGSQYGSTDFGKGRSAIVEYVSANPTGPLHVGHMRGAIIGDVVSNLLQFVGYRVTREYYINDGGSQIVSLAKSVYLRYLEAHGRKVDFGEDLYPGEYLKAVGNKLKQNFGNSLMDLSFKEWFGPVSSIAVEEMLNLIKDDLAAIGIKMDSYFSEKSLYSDGIIEKSLNFLQSNDLVYEGVLPPPKGRAQSNWEQRKQLLFKSTQFGDDVDRALKKGDGEWTYFAPDVAYHFDKLARGYHIIIDILGADHAGYVKRMQAAVAALSKGASDLEVKLCQLVRLYKNGVPYKMSKRAGNFVLLRDVVNEVGADIARFVMLMRKNDAPLDFDFDKALDQSKDNPVFYVQYAHARATSILTKAEQNDMVESHVNINLEQFNLLSETEERDLIKIIAMWPKVVELAAKNREPHRISFYLYDLAASFHALQHKGKINPKSRFIIKTEPDVSAARLSLVNAAKIVLSTGLTIVGVVPKDKM